MQLTLLDNAEVEAGRKLDLYRLVHILIKLDADRVRLS